MTVDDRVAACLRTRGGIARVLRAYADATDAGRAVPAYALRDLAARLEQMQAELAAWQESSADDFPP